MIRGLIELAKVTQTCTACPSQWDAWSTDGKYVYIRYRSGILTVEVSGDKVFERKIGDNLSGHLLWSDVLAIAPIIEAQPEP